MGERQSGTVDSNSWSNSFPLQKDELSLLTNVLLSGKDVWCLDQEFEATVPDGLSPVWNSNLGTKLDYQYLVFLDNKFSSLPLVNNIIDSEGKGLFKIIIITAIRLS